MTASERRGDGNGRADLLEHGRQFRQRAEALSGSASDLATDAEHFVVHQVRKKPYVTLAVAAGVGFVLGGGLAPRVFRRFMGTLGRMVVDLFLVRMIGGSESEYDDDEGQTG